MTKIKLCGMTRAEDIFAINEIKPDYIGFVFWDKSSRNVTREKARDLKKLLSDGIKTVGVFVDAEISLVTSLYEDGIIDIAQLHGKEDEEYILGLKALGIPTIKSFKVTGEASLKEAEASKSDYIIFDPGKGSGAVFNWQLIKNVKRPYFLAGGLDASNVKEAILTTNPYAVDVSSGIETDKKKDPAKMRAFVKEAREALNK